jgi:hypothetical protein
MYRSVGKMALFTLLFTGPVVAFEEGNSLEGAFGAVHVPLDNIESLEGCHTSYSVSIGENSYESCGCITVGPKKSFTGAPKETKHIAQVPCGSQLKCNKLFADECESEQDDMMTLAECLARSQRIIPNLEESNIAFSPESDRAIEESERDEFNEID